MELKKIEDKIILIYHYTEYIQDDWVRKNLREIGRITFKRTFDFLKKDEYKLNLENDTSTESGIINYFLQTEIPSIAFVLATLNDNDYYHVKKRVIGTENQVYLSKDIELSIKYFIADNNISIFQRIDSITSNDIYVGGKAENAIPIIEFDKLIKNFPTNYEKKIYAQARISSIIKNYIQTKKDYESTFQNYLNNKPSKIGTNLNKLFQDYEIVKFSTILEKLEAMLISENSYSEDQWQNEILDIILLLYPKYILSFKSVYVKIDNKKRRFLDFMLVDYNGNIDVIEIKKPFENSIMTGSLYRNNHIPHKDLIGTVMQLEKYIYHLNRWGDRGEKSLSKKYQKELPEGLNIKITNPKGFIIMGRDNNLSNTQKADFEIVKRKYKNVIDVITYDDLIERLKFTIGQIKAK